MSMSIKMDMETAKKNMRTNVGVMLKSPQHAQIHKLFTDVFTQFHKHASKLVSRNTVLIEEESLVY